MQKISQDVLYYKNTLPPILDTNKKCTSKQQKAVEDKIFPQTNPKITFKDWQKTNFDINNYLFSLSSLTINTCRQDDVYKLEDFLSHLQKRIHVSLSDCINPSKYIDIYEEALSMMKYIRDYDEDNDDNNKKIIERTGKTSFDYWDEELYAPDSKVCRTESWAEFTRSFCEISENIKNFGDDKPTWGEIFDFDKADSEQVKKIQESRKRKARANATAYVNANIPIPFLRIKAAQSSKTNSNEFSTISGFFKLLLAPIINIRDDLNSSAYSSNNSLEVFSIHENLTNSSVTVLEVHKMLESLSYNYSKSFAAQLSLEHTINEITESVKSTTGVGIGPKPKETFYDFVKKLQSTEDDVGAYKCRLPAREALSEK